MYPDADSKNTAREARAPQTPQKLNKDLGCLSPRERKKSDTSIISPDTKVIDSEDKC